MYNTIESTENLMSKRYGSKKAGRREGKGQRKRKMKTRQIKQGGVHAL